MNSIKSAAILVAAGRGERLAEHVAGELKQFMILGKSPLFIWSLAVLVKHPAIEQVLMTVPQGWHDKVSELVTRFLPEHIVKINFIEGGETRQQSVFLALEKLSQNVKQPAYVLVHDAVRPFITSEIIDKILSKLEKNKAITLGIPLTDSIKRVDNDNVLEDLERNKFMLVQTPQAAEFNSMLEAHRNAKIQQTQYTDDAAILKSYGIPVAIVPGSKLNFKITDSEDLQFAQALIKEELFVPCSK